jgi:hypothetical protein
MLRDLFLPPKSVADWCSANASIMLVPQSPEIDPSQSPPTPQLAAVHVEADSISFWEGRGGARRKK